MKMPTTMQRARGLVMAPSKVQCKALHQSLHRIRRARLKKMIPKRIYPIRVSTLKSLPMVQQMIHSQKLLKPISEQVPGHYASA